MDGLGRSLGLSASSRSPEEPAGHKINGDVGSRVKSGKCSQGIGRS